MFGDAIPIRFSRRIKRKSIFLPANVPARRKIRKSSIKSRASAVNSSKLKAREKTKVCAKNKDESFIQTSKILKLASCDLKFVAHKSPQKSILKICDKKRKARNVLKTSHVNLTNNKVSLKNIELFDKSKEAIKKKNHKKLANEIKQPVRRSLNLSKSSPSPKQKRKNKELSDSDLKPLEKRKSCQKESTNQVTTLNSKSVPTVKTKKYTHAPKLSGRKKTARLSSKLCSEEISVHTPLSKSLSLTSVPIKVTCISNHSGNKKSGRLLKKPNNSRRMKSGVSLNTLSCKSLLENPLPEKQLQKRKSRSLELDPLRTLNNELPWSTRASLLARNVDFTQNKSSKSCKSNEHLSFESCSRKPNRPKVSNKDGSTVSYKKKKQQVNQHHKDSENLEKPLSHKCQNLSLDILTTPGFKLPSGKRRSKKYLSKSDSKSTKRKLSAAPSENQIASEELQDATKRKSADFSKIPTKGTIKYKRWLLNNLREKNGSYEDDIFENQNFDLHKPAFHFGDDSDGSSINIATPKFDCILTPVLPKKTPLFKDCISPTEFLRARKSAEEYLYRRNKKRRTGEKPSSSGKNTSVNKKKTIEDIPEKKKLDFEDAVNNLLAVQKNLDVEAEVDDDEEEDIYFSDASN